MMAIALTDDRFVTLQECRDILGMNDDPKTTILINAVSEKFRQYTNRVRINQGQVNELTRAVDDILVWSHATPIDKSQEVRIQISDSLGDVIKSYSSNDGDLTVDWARGRIARSGCQPFDSFCGCATTAGNTPSGECGGNGEKVAFPTLELSYLGGWPVVPGDIVMTAFEQIKLDLERLKGTIGLTAASGFQDVVDLQGDHVLRSVAAVWKRYRILI